MTDDDTARALGAALLRAKRAVLPPGSRRERWARLVYVPLWRRLVARRLARIAPEPRVLMLAGEPVAALPPGGRVLVLKLDHIGDLVVALPALAQLRRALPDAAITLVCGAWNRSLATASGLADHVETFDAFATRDLGPAAGRVATGAEFAGLAARLGRFDLALDLRHDPDTRALLGRVDARVRAGYAAPGVALDIALPDVEHLRAARGERPLHARTRLVMLVAAVLDAVRPASRPGAVLLADGGALPPELVARLAPGDAYAVLAPGAGVPLRVWPVARMAVVAEALAARHGLRIVLLGGPGDRALAAAIGDRLPAGTAIDLIGQCPLAAAPAILAGARLMVGMDSGLTHLAASLGVATVSVQSGAPTREVWRAAGARVVVVAGDANCAPCHLDLPRDCPHGVACLDAVTARHVLDACEAVLAQAPRRDSGLGSATEMA